MFQDEKKECHIRLNSAVQKSKVYSLKYLHVRVKLDYTMS